MKENKIISWQTFKKKYNPKIVWCPDGVFPINYSVHPTLVNFGFEEIGSFTEYRLPKKPKEVAKDIYEDFMSAQVIKPENQIVVYHVHVGSSISTMPITVTVYMGCEPNKRKT